MTGALVSAGAVQADDRPAKGNDAVSVQFVEPENYSDFATSQMGGKEERQALQKELRNEIQRIADRYVPPDYKLHLRFRDIDMAGEFEPQAGPEFNNVRIMRAIYAPSMLVEYEVTGPSGSAVASGTRRISDITFQNVVSFRKDERLFYETELITDLVRDITRSL